jgi:hypothetical protein
VRSHQIRLVVDAILCNMCAVLATRPLLEMRFADISLTIARQS